MLNNVTVCGLESEELSYRQRSLAFRVWFNPPQSKTKTSKHTSSQRTSTFSVPLPDRKKSILNDCYSKKIGALLKWVADDEGCVFWQELIVFAVSNTSGVRVNSVPSVHWKKRMSSLCFLRDVGTLLRKVLRWTLLNIHTSVLIYLGTR